MVGQAEAGGLTVHYCEICFLEYADGALARKCEDYCRTHPSCSLEIGRQAIGTFDQLTKRGAP